MSTKTSSTLQIGFMKCIKQFIVYSANPYFNGEDGNDKNQFVIVYDEFMPSTMVKESDIIPFEYVCPNNRMLGLSHLNNLKECYTQMAGIALIGKDYDMYHKCIDQASSIQEISKKL